MLHTPTKSLLIPTLGLLLVTQLLVTPGCSSDEKDCTIIVEADADGAEDTVVFVDSSVTEDYFVPDTGEPEEEDTTPEPGGLGAPCGDNTDCESGYCIESPTGFVCTKTCLTDCPTGWSCKSVINTQPDVVFICVPDVLSLCLPCDEDKQCGGGRCIDVGTGKFCASGCPQNGCPTGFSCANEGGEELCIPDSGTCDCSIANDGQVRSCAVTNEFGSCPGVETCDGLVGWTPCSASTPIAEICDGQDNDCDGSLDEDLIEAATCEQSNEFGNCEGVLTCLGVQGSVCSASEPSPELCDYKDNDCDGETDEDYKINGKYADALHCGQCNASCQGAIPFAQSTCNAVDFDPPVCVVDECLSGYYEVNSFLCSPLPGKQCDPCDGPEDCLSQGSQCVPIGSSTFCAAPCDQVPCSAGFTCTDDPTAGLVCIPETGSCTCDGQNSDLQKACELTYTDPENSDITITCAGVETCEADGWSPCTPPEDVCDGLDNDCDGLVDGPWVNEDGVYATAENCGVCGNNCLVAPPANSIGFCDVSGTVPACGITCQDGYFNVDGLPSNGCECGFQSDTDYPDGADQNCDGVDGEINNAIFVAKTGDDTNPGTIDSPKRTILGGITAAAAQAKRDVYVATGVYSESVNMTPNVSLYGGYSGDFLARDIVLYETAILGPAPVTSLPATVNAPGFTDDSGATTTLAGFSIFGWNSLQPGGSSYGVWAPEATSQLRIANNRIYAGSGGNGTPGASGVSGASGQDGATGLAAKDVGDSSCDDSDASFGGSGGVHSCGNLAVNGGNGGAAQCPNFNESVSFPACPAGAAQNPEPSESGQDGLGNSAGAGGASGFDSYINARYGPFNDYDCQTYVVNNCNQCLLPGGQQKVGANGVAGGDGEPGNGGGGCSESGTVVNNLWVSGNGGSGAPGGHGSGGGGGGAAGGVETVLCSADDTAFTDIGGSGGGGGSGGCAGTSGSGGQGGGGSFGIFLSWSATPTSLPVLEGNELFLGNGGAGGNGGTGGVGGAGGAAGAGGLNGQAQSATFCTEGGGKGGPGGAGGAGGGGGGGCGGVSYGIFVFGAPGNASWQTANFFTETGNGGLGGGGGASIGISGTDGISGAIQQTNF